MGMDLARAAVFSAPGLSGCEQQRKQGPIHLDPTQLSALRRISRRIPKYLSTAL